MAKSSAKLGGHHVAPGESGWRVVRAGATRASSCHETQAEAIEAARKLVRRHGTDLYIHGRDGRVREVVYSGQELAAAAE